MSLTILWFSEQTRFSLLQVVLEKQTQVPLSKAAELGPNHAEHGLQNLLIGTKACLSMCSIPRELYVDFIVEQELSDHSCRLLAITTAKSTKFACLNLLRKKEQLVKFAAICNEYICRSPDSSGTADLFGACSRTHPRHSST